MAFLQVQSKASYSLAGSGAVAGATSITLKSFQSIDDVDYSMSDFGAKGYLTLEPGNGDQEEQVSFTGLTQNANGTCTLSGVKTVLFVSPYTETSGLAKTHPGSSSVVVSNTAGYYEQFGHLANDDVITGYWEGLDPITAQGLATKNYVDTLVNGGTVSTNALKVTGTAGETVAAGNLVYLKDSDGRWWLTDADTAATVENVVLGISQGVALAGVSIPGGVLISGTDTNQSGLTPNTIYYASNTAGGISSSAGTKEVTVGIALSASTLAFAPRFNQMVTEDELDAMSGGGNFGTPSSSNKFLTEDYNSSASGLPTNEVFVSTSSSLGGTTTQFDITNPAGSTFRYTFDGTGTDPGITALTVPTGCQVAIKSTSIAAVNCGVFIVTGSGANYFEVTNASGSAENNVTLANGYLYVQLLQTWTKPSDLKYVIVELVAGGGAGGGEGSNEGGGGGGGGGGYSRKLIAAASLGATENVLVGLGGPGRVSADGNTGGSSYFGAHCSATGGGGGGENNDSDGGEGGIGSSGDFNSRGDGGGGGWNDAGSGPTTPKGGKGGSSLLGGGMPADGTNVGYGGGGSGTIASSGAGSDGGTGAVVVYEYYS